MQMTEIEKLEAQIKCRRIVEGTGFNWWNAVKLTGEFLEFPPAFDYLNKDAYEFALGIIEGKLAWEGDEVYLSCVENTRVYKIKLDSAFNLSKDIWSWNPPKPKTVTVELLIEDASDFITYHYMVPRNNRIKDAIKKELEK